MKKVIFFVFLISLSLFPAYRANAISETRYLRVINEETAFYSDEDENSFLFFLPYTYYVKVIEIKENYLYVELLPDNAPSLDGYVKKEDLFEDGQEVISPYPSVILTTVNDCAFYKDKNCRNAVTYLFKNRNLNFYGYYKTDENLYVYFVSYNGKLGYVKESDVSPFDVKNHPNELTFLDNSTESHETVGVFSPEEDVSPEKNETIKLVIVILLAFAGVLALFVALFPKKPKKEENYYDENDFF